MDWWNGLKIRVQADAPLGERTWFRLGGPARWMVWPTDVESAAAVMLRAEECGIPWRVLGRGANVLVADEGFDGIVMVLDDLAEREDTEWRKRPPSTPADPAGVTVTAYASIDLMKLSHRCSQGGFAGLECMAGIPGTVGGAVCMNAGGRWGAFGDVVQSVDLIDSAGRVIRRNRDEMEFGYRSSNARGCIVWRVDLELHRDDPEATLARFHDIWKAKKAEQPMADRSAGCIFKNPPGLSAGKLIDEAGLKDTRRGGAWVSSRHANFILAESTAKANDVVELIEVVRTRVEAHHGIRLQTEIDLWGPAAIASASVTKGGMVGE